MRPVSFHEANRTYVAPEGVGHDVVQDLPTHVDANSGAITSCWEMSSEEQTLLLQTGCVWLVVAAVGYRLPPVMLTVVPPNMPECSPPPPREVTRELQEAKAHIQRLQELYSIEAAKVAKLQKFKQYVHDRLDNMGVPVDPQPDMTKLTGCRIEGRLDWVQPKVYPDTIKQREALRICQDFFNQMAAQGMERNTLPAEYDIAKDVVTEVLR